MGTPSKSLPDPYLLAPIDPLEPETFATDDSEAVKAVGKLDIESVGEGVGPSSWPLRSAEELTTPNGAKDETLEAEVNRILSNRHQHHQ